METKTASTRTEGLLKLFDMQTSFLERALAGIPEEDMHNRLNTKANHMAWLTGSLVAQRFEMAKEISHGLKQTGEELFKDNKGIQDDVKYPMNAAYIEDWKKISPAARAAIVNADDAKLGSMIDMGFVKMSAYDLMSFMIYREASIFGQLALWRRLLNYPAMKYD